MRRNPISIFEKVSRLMVESDYFGSKTAQGKLLDCAYFFSKGINDPVVFEFVRSDLIKRKILPIKKEFSFETYKREISELRNLITLLLTGFFQTPWVLTATKKYLLARNVNSDEDLKSISSTFWKRFENTFDSLTTKQKNAIEKVYLRENQLSYIEAAAEFQISIDSFKDRIDGIHKKFEKNLPELEFLGKNLTYREVHKYNNLQRGLFNQSEANKINTLYHVELPEETTIEIPKRKGKNKTVVTDYWLIDEIQAWAEAEKQVPDFLDTEYFDSDLVPDLLKVRVSGESMYKGHGLRSKRIKDKGS